MIRKIDFHVLNIISLTLNIRKSLTKCQIVWDRGMKKRKKKK